MYPAAVMHQLGDRPRAHRPHVIRLVAYRIQRGLHPFVYLSFAADPYSQLARPRSLRPAAHRRVQHVYPARRQFRLYPPDEVGRTCAEIEIHLALAQTLANPVLAKRDRLYLHRPPGSEVRTPTSDPLSDLARRVRPLRAHLQVRRSRLPPYIMNDKPMPAPYRVQRHRAAHSPKPNKSDVHRIIPLYSAHEIQA